MVFIASFIFYSLSAHDVLFSIKKETTTKIKFLYCLFLFQSIVPGGKCNTVLVANICGEALHVEETVS